MAFQNFTFPQVEQLLGLTLAEGDLFSRVAPIAVRPEFAVQILEGANLAGAAHLVKQSTASPVKTVYGVVTTGSLWKYLRLEGTQATLDLVEYHIDNLGKIMGILGSIVESN